MTRVLCQVAMLTFLSMTGRAACAQWQLPPGTSSSVDTSTTKPPEDPHAAALRTAEEKLEAQDWPAAMKLLRPLAASATDERANYDLGYALDSTDDVAGAKAAYGRAVTADATAAEPHIALGLLLARSGDLPGAEQSLSAAVALPAFGKIAAAQQAQTYRALARLHLAAAPDKSRDELAAALKLSPETPADTALAGEVAEALHSTPDALAAFARAWQSAPADPELTAQYARALNREGKLEEEAHVLLPALAAHPDNTALLTEDAALLLKQENFVAAAPVLEKLHRADPANNQVARLLARAYVAQGKPDQAIPLLKELVKATPEDGELLSAYADALIRQKQNAEAEAVLEEALTAQYPAPQGRAQAAAELAFAASADHHPEVVLRAVNIRNATLPPDASSSFLLATAHDTLHHTRQAAESYRRFLELANGKFPDEEWQAKQRLQILSRVK